MSTVITQLLFCAAGCFVGIYVGAIPGLSVTMATSLLIAMTYSWSTEAALAVMMGVYIGGVYGGSRAAILLNIPGAPSAVATTFDGYPLAKRGEAGQAIATSTITSVIGGLIGTAFLFFGAPQVSKIALSFGPRDYMLLTIMGLMLVGGISGKSMWKGLFAACIGLMLGVVGMDPITGSGRFTFGSTDMRAGISYIPVMIGLFGVGESLYQIIHRNQPIVKQKVDKLRPPMKKLGRMTPIAAFAGVIGTIVGALPGAGGDIAALLAYDATKRVVRHPERPFGEGTLEGVVAPESANNAAIGGALIPMLTLGIPGDSVTAIFIGALSIHGIRAGSMLMTEQPQLFTNLVWLSLVANIFLLIFGMMGIRLFAKLVEIPRNILLPIIIVISVIGSYSINNLTLDIVWTLVAGIIGYFMKYYDVPVAPLVLGLILGPTIEVNMRRSIISAGSVGGMFVDIFTHPLSVVLFAIVVLMLVTQIISNIKKNRVVVDEEAVE